MSTIQTPWGLFQLVYRVDHPEPYSIDRQRRQVTFRDNGKRGCAIPIYRAFWKRYGRHRNLQAITIGRERWFLERLIVPLRDGDAWPVNVDWAGRTITVTEGAEAWDVALKLAEAVAEISAKQSGALRE